MKLKVIRNFYRIPRKLCRSLPSYKSLLKKQNMSVESSTDWQKQCSTLRERSKYAFDKSLFWDVKFSVVDGDGNSVNIPSNKYILALTSPVFEKMFYGNLPETAQTIPLPGCSKEALQEMLRYAHCEEANLTRSNVMEVLYLAKQYAMPFLEEECKKRIEPEDVFTVLPEVQKTDDKDFTEHLWSIVDDETYRAISSESFLGVSKEIICQLLERDTLRVSELHLFQAVHKWANKQIAEKKLTCDGKTKRDILGEEIIRLIRFSLMPEKEFFENVYRLKVLNRSEEEELFQIFYGITPSTQIFNSTRRRFLPDVARFSNINNIRPPTITSWCYSEPDAINITVNKDVQLIGVRLFGREGSKYNVRLRVCRNNRSDCLAELSSSFMSENIHDLYYGFTVTLDTPVQLIANHVYTLEAKISGPFSYYGQFGQKYVHVGDIQVTYTTARLPNNSNNVHQGQFPSILLQ